MARVSTMPRRISRRSSAVSDGSIAARRRKPSHASSEFFARPAPAAVAAVRRASSPEDPPAWDAPSNRRPSSCGNALRMPCRSRPGSSAHSARCDRRGAPPSGIQARTDSARRQMRQALERRPSGDPVWSTCVLPEGLRPSESSTRSLARSLAAPVRYGSAHVKLTTLVDAPRSLARLDDPVV